MEDQVSDAEVCMLQQWCKQSRSASLELQDRADTEKWKAGFFVTLVEVMSACAGASAVTRVYFAEVDSFDFISAFLSIAIVVVMSMVSRQKYTERSTRHRHMATCHVEFATDLELFLARNCEVVAAEAVEALHSFGKRRRDMLTGYIPSFVPLPGYPAGTVKVQNKRHHSVLDMPDVEGLVAAAQDRV